MQGIKANGLCFTSFCATAARSGADLLPVLLTLTPHIRPSDIDTELGLRGLTMGGLDMVGNWPVDGTLLVGGQHLDASHAAAVRGPSLGHASIQSSVLVIDPLGSPACPVSTNSGCIVVE